MTPDEIIPEKKEEQPVSLEKDKQGKKKEGSFVYIALVMIASLMIATFWDKIPYLKDAIHSVLDPTAGALLKLDLTVGMLIIVLLITFITTIIQKYTTDQKALKELRNEQKLLQEEMKKYKDHPEKLAELSKKQFEFIPKTFKLTSRGVLFTGIPFILFYRWFFDVFTVMGDPKFLGFLNWFWFYFICAMIFTSILRKWMKVV
jgi:uncharacterized membrane protein (DUF106 family)